MAATPRPVIRAKRFSTSSVLGKAYAFINGQAANQGLIPAPNPPISDVQAQVDKVESCYKASLSRTKGTAAACKVEREVLYGMLQSECIYVTNLCKASPEKAQAIIQASGFDSSVAPVQDNSLLRVIRGPVSGSVILDAAVALLMGSRNKKAKFFSWQSTLDGGKTFGEIITTPTGKATMESFTPLTTVGFRVRVTTSDGAGDWSPIVSILVH